MTPSVHFTVARAARIRPVHVLLRLAILVVLGSASWSTLYALVYFAVPVYAAVVVSQRGAATYLREAPAIGRVLRWVGGVYAYLLFLTEAFPLGDGEGDVDLRIEAGGAPRVGSALARLVTSLPALLVLALLSIVSALVWMIGAAAILVGQRMPEVLGDFLEDALRYRMRFLAYHLSLVDEYPSFGDAPAQLSQSGAS